MIPCFKDVSKKPLSCIIKHSLCMSGNPTYHKLMDGTYTEGKTQDGTLPDRGTTLAITGGKQSCLSRKLFLSGELTPNGSQLLDMKKSAIMRGSMSMTAKDQIQTYNQNATMMGHGPHSKSTSGECCGGQHGSLNNRQAIKMARDTNVLRS